VKTAPGARHAALQAVAGNLATAGSLTTRSRCRGGQGQGNAASAQKPRTSTQRFHGLRILARRSGSGTDAGSGQRYSVGSRGAVENRRDACLPQHSQAAKLAGAGGNRPGAAIRRAHGIRRPTDGLDHPRGYRSQRRHRPDRGTGRIAAAGPRWNRFPRYQPPDFFPASRSMCALGVTVCLYDGAVGTGSHV
jgi:hypothetical protein